MSEEIATPKSLDDYIFLFEALKRAGISPVLVGGLSVRFWQEEYRTEIQMPVVYSKDLDLLVQSLEEAHAVEIATGLPFRWSESDSASPCLAVCKDPDHPTDLLWFIWGPKKEDVIGSALTTYYKGCPIRVISPAKLLESKLANCRLDQSTRLDIDHLRAVCELYPHFIRKTFESARAAGASERDQINILKRMAKFLESMDRTFYLKTLGGLRISIPALFSAESLKQPNTPTFNRFVNDTFIPTLLEAEYEQGLNG